MRELEGFGAVLTGAAGGLGEATARRFVEEGARVVVSDLDGARALALALAIDPSGERVLGIGCDVTRADDCTRLVAAAEKFFGAAVDVFVANAGIGFAGSLLEARPEEISRVVEVNVVGSLLSARAALTSLTRSSRASLIFTGSLQGVTARPMRSVYTTSKHAIVGLVKSLALDFGPLGVRVNAIAPAATDTAFLRTQWTRAAKAPVDYDEAKRKAAGALPLGRLPTPDDFADAAVFLASNRARSISGQHLLLDGGAAAGAFDPGSIRR